MKIGLATNDNEAGARAHLKAMGLLDYFDAVVGADSGFGGKPAPGMIEGCAGQMGLKSSQVVMVGDTDRDTWPDRPLVALKSLRCSTVRILPRA